MAACCSALLLASLSILEVVLFQQVFVAQLRDVIQLQEDDFTISGSAPVFLTLLSVTNLCFTLLHLITVLNASRKENSRIQKLCAGKLHCTKTAVFCWFLIKISFSICLFLVLWTRADHKSSEQFQILLLIGCSCGKSI